MTCVLLCLASHLVETKDAVFQTGAGVYEEGKYVQVAFELTGQGQFKPGAGADPHTGTVGELERVLEYRVEILCVGRDVTKAAVAALKRCCNANPKYCTVIKAKISPARIHTRYRHMRCISWKTSRCTYTTILRC